MLIEVLQQKGAKKIAYIYIDSTYGQTGKETFDRAVKDMKFTPAIIEKYAPGTTDVAPQRLPTSKLREQTEFLSPATSRILSWSSKMQKIWVLQVLS